MTINHVTLTGNLCADPELRFTPSGKAVANLAIAYTPKRYNRDLNTWEDGTTMFIRGSIWDTYAENAAETLTKGIQVIVSGRLEQNNYTTKEGEHRSVLQMQIADIGPTLRWSTAKVTRTKPQAAASASGGGAASQPDPWGSAPPMGGYNDMPEEPPF